MKGFVRLGCVYAVVFWKKKQGFVRGLAAKYLFLFFLYFFLLKNLVYWFPLFGCIILIVELRSPAANWQ